MNSITMAFLLTSMAGFSTMLGLLPIFFHFKNEDTIISFGLSFAAGVMICVSVFDLIPESILILEKFFSGFLVCFFCFSFLFLGIIVASFVERRVILKKDNFSLYRVGIISMIAIILHNIPEGIVTFISTTTNTSLGISLAISIALHNIPEGISIGLPIYYGTKSKSKAILYTFISALSEPFGALITYLFLLPFMNQFVLGLMFSFIAGVMIEISMSELLPSAHQYTSSKKMYIFFFIGALFMLLKFLF